MSSDTTAKLVRMINQIAANLAHEPLTSAAVAEHVSAFWTPRMIGQLIEHCRAHGDEELDPNARVALMGLAIIHDPETTLPAAQGADGG